MGLLKLYLSIVSQMRFICQSPLQELSQVSRKNRRYGWSFNQRPGFTSTEFGLDKSRTLAPHPDHSLHLSKTPPFYTGQLSKICGATQSDIPV